MRIYLYRYNKATGALEMNVKVERCSNNSFRLTLPQGQRESIPNPDNGWWNRTAAKRALNLIESIYGVNRKAIRFQH